MPPLSGVRILDLGRIVAAPFAAQLLGDLGAEVIKIERKGFGDDSRNYGPSFLNDGIGEPLSGFYMSFNRNKKSISVDIATPEGRQIVLDLAKSCDVLLENFKVGDLDRRGLSYADVAAVNPSIIYCSITGFGQTGPYAALPAVDMVFQAMSGLMSITGEADGPPQKVGIVVSDIICGLYAANAIQAALRARDRNAGKGDHIDMSLLDCMVAAMSHRAMDYFLIGQAPMRSGNVSKAVTPAQLFECSDGLLNVQAGTDGQFPLFCRAIGRPDMASDPRFRTSGDRRQNTAALLDLIGEIFRQDRVSTWCARLRAGGVICSPVYDMAATFTDPQVEARELRITMESVKGRRAPNVRNPIRFASQATERYEFPPDIGQHTDEILGSMLGLSPDRIAELRAAGAI